MRAEVKEKLTAGLSDDQVYAAFVGKYGSKVLAAPPFKGAFNITSWLLSLAALLAGGLGLIIYLRRLRPPAPQPSSASVDVSKFDRKIQDELDNFTPED